MKFWVTMSVNFFCNFLRTCFQYVFFHSFSFLNSKTRPFVLVFVFFVFSFCSKKPHSEPTAAEVGRMPCVLVKIQKRTRSLKTKDDNLSRTFLPAILSFFQVLEKRLTTKNQDPKQCVVFNSKNLKHKK